VVLGNILVVVVIAAVVIVIVIVIVFCVLDQQFFGGVLLTRRVHVRLPPYFSVFFQRTQQPQRKKTPPYGTMGKDRRPLGVEACPAWLAD
jgi:hypothetical protein